MPELRVEVEPVEPILFGDNRAGSLADQDPSPATLYGAIGARIAARLGARGERRWSIAEPVLGPFEERLDRPSDARAELRGYALADEQGRAWFPRPLHLRVDQSAASRFALPLLRPSPREALGSLPRGAHSLGAPAAAVQGEVREEDSELLVTEDLLGDVLAGAAAELGGDLRPHLCEASSLAAPELRPGLGMVNATNTAAPGRLFARPYRRFRGALGPAGEGFRSAGFVAWLRVPSLAGHDPASFDGMGFLGGDRRRARFRFAAAAAEPLEPIAARALAAAAAAEGFVVYLLTPAVTLEAPVSFGGLRPVAAVVGRARAVSGWTGSSAAPAPRPMVTLLPAGSVFFFTWPPDCGEVESRRAWAQRHWLECLDPTYRNAGFGRVLIGAWPR